MNKTDLEYFKLLLNSQLKELEERIGYSDIQKMTINDVLQDTLDIASADVDKNMLLRIRERESRLISKIKDALSRVEDGSYGICEKCGSDIPIKRLNARPVTSQCIDCKEKEEALERAYGSKAFFPSEPAIQMNRKNFPIR